MAALTTYQIFTDIEQIPLESISLWLKAKIDLRELDNYLGNRLLYPTTGVVEKAELNLELAVLREALRRDPKKLYDALSNKIIIPLGLVEYLGSLKNIVLSIIDVLALNEVTTVLVRDKEIKSSGTIIIPKMEPNQNTIDVVIDGQKMTLNRGKLSLINSQGASVTALINGKNLNLNSGELGLIFDLRKKDGSVLS